MKFQTIFMQVPEGYIGFVEELPGANTQGATLDEAQENLYEAVKLVLEANRELAEDSTEVNESIIASPGGTRLMLYLEKMGCQLLRNHEHHSIYVNPANKKVAAVPQLDEIGDHLVRRICNDLGIPKP